MGSVRIEVNPEILKWALHHTDSELPTTTVAKVNQWISKESDPTVKQLISFSNQSKIPFGYFFLDDVPHDELPIMKFRTIDNAEIHHPSRNLIDTVNDMQTKQIWLASYRKDQGFEKNGFINSQKFNKNLNYQEIASNILNYLDIDIDWNVKKPQKFNAFNFIREKITASGITVMYSSFVGNSTRRSLNEDEFRAFALLDDYAPLIFVNSHDSYNAMLFSLLHEAVHLWLGESELYNDNFQSNQKFRHPAIEQKINKVVEHILFPEKEFVKYWKEQDIDDKLEKINIMASLFSTSAFAAGIRALHLNLISQNTLNQLQEDVRDKYKAKKEHQKSLSGGPSFYKIKASKLDNLFANDVILSAKNGDITYSNAFELLNVKNNNSFNKLVESLQGTN